jgi:hypothetical protein
MKNYSLYDFPELYDSLRTPDMVTFRQVYELIVDCLGRKPASVMDPACGPATWLSHFAKQNIYVAGNDICPEMIENAKEKCGHFAAEFIVGDMCDLRFTKSPFDVTLEIAGTCGLLADETNFIRFLESILHHTASGGLILLTVFFVEDSCCGDFPIMVDKWGPVEVAPRGQAWISYEVVASEPSRNIDFVRRTVRTRGVEACPVPLIDEYEMSSWDPDHFWSVLSQFSQLEYLTAFRHDDPVGICVCHDRQMIGETTVILKKKPENLSADEI